jgi:spore maturation protein CgeB
MARRKPGSVYCGKHPELVWPSHKVSTLCSVGKDLSLKITIFGLTLSSSWGNGHATPYRAILRALARRGHRITFYEKDVEYYSLRRDFDSCDYADLKLYSAWEDIRKEALAECAASDVVMTASFVPDGARINDEVLELPRPLRVFYDLDTPVTLSKLEHGRTDYIRADQLKEFDLVLSWTGGHALERLRSEYGAQMARPLFGCVDPDNYKRVAAKNEFRCALSYMGTYASDRQAKLDALFLEPSRRRPDARFLMAGTLYPWQWQWPANVRRLDHVSPSDHAALYSSSRMTLNITRAEMAASGFCPSGRFFEAAACGTPIVTDWFLGLDAFFTPEKEIFVAEGADDVLRAMDRSDSELETVAKRARQRTLDEHTGDRRADSLLRYIGEARVANVLGSDLLGAAS